MKLKPLPILVTLVSIACLGSTVAYTSSQLSNKNAHPQQNTPTTSNVPKEVENQLLASSAPSVVVVEVKADTYKALVKGYGEASAHYAITYSAEVSGRVQRLMPSFETGKLVKKGDVLATLENTTYLQAVAAAKSDLAQAELDLLEEERTGEQARLEWKRSGMTGEPNSPLVLREPQLAAQIAVVENAKYSLKKAQQDLDKTVIKAPFDALVVERNIQPGSYAQVGTSVAKLYSTDLVEIEIPLSMKQWQSLPKLTNSDISSKDNAKWPATLYSSDGENSWEGYVTRVEQHVDVASRQRSLVIAVDKPFEQDVGLFPGTFVQAHIEGAMLNNTWELPASAISQQGDIWYLTENNQLNKVPAIKVFEKSGSVYVSPIEDISSAQIIKRPLSNYVVGMLMTPKLEG